MIATMNISKAKDNDGQEITPPYAFTSGFVSRSYSFRCHIAPRTAKAESLIRQMRIATESVET
ncbi:hypothetical protein QCA50_009805 [Cerrena zonata]|uniref:Uncharacterized protein n=1 Tax=Cerrena zonata TaxID=2478898 RepID=A0AAW0G1E5_9APHY